LLFALFAASGFAGLVYESIWTHYLKLFLGHAAYAQTLAADLLENRVVHDSLLPQYRVYGYNRFEACRFGFEAELVDAFVTGMEQDEDAPRQGASGIPGLFWKPAPRAA